MKLSRYLLSIEAKKRNCRKRDKKEGIEVAETEEKCVRLEIL
jgi:hypothetical protein